jgi:hypothetical protein
VLLPAFFYLDVHDDNGFMLFYINGIPCAAHSRRMSSGQMLAWISPMCAFCK